MRSGAGTRVTTPTPSLVPHSPAKCIYGTCARSGRHRCRYGRHICSEVSGNLTKYATILTSQVRDGLEQGMSISSAMLQSQFGKPIFKTFALQMIRTFVLLRCRSHAIAHSKTHESSFSFYFTIFNSAFPS